MKDVYDNVERRGYVWQCANSSHKNRKYRGKTHDSDKEPCGHFNVYFGRKWMAFKKASRWTGKCVNPECGRRKQLNLGCVQPENPDYFETRQEAIEYAKKKNAEKKKKDEEDWF